jgi:septal ring factor EnvC (AmiA/AmiB activator)
MADYATKEDVQGIVSKAVDDLSTVMATFMQQVDERFNNVERGIRELKDSHNRLLNTIDGFIARIDAYETEMQARDRQYERLLVWARKVSKKTGIPLENL